MNKKNKISFTPFVAIFIIIIAIMVLTIGSSKFDVAILNDEKEIVHEQSIEAPFVSDITQSFFGADHTFPFYMQSTQPITEENIAVFRAVVTNPFDKPAQLINAKTYKNNELINEKEFLQFFINAGQDYIYKSDEIDLKGLDAQTNILQIEFLFQADNGEQKTSTFRYDYLSLTKCKTDADCTDPINNKCDIGNLARFSDTIGEYYCVRSCASNSNCYTGQVCIRGYCGY